MKSSNSCFQNDQQRKLLQDGIWWNVFGDSCVICGLLPIELQRQNSKMDEHTGKKRTHLL